MLCSTNRIPIPPQGKFTLRRRPRVLPSYWRMAHDGQTPRTWAQQTQWALVLDACHIPFMQSKRGQRSHFYVPALYETMACAEIRDYSLEGQRCISTHSVPVYPSASWAVLWMLALLLWCGVQLQWWTVPIQWRVPPQDWIRVGGLDVVHITIYKQWYRAVTALTLHADSVHLLGNLAFGSLFMIILARLQGVGLGLFLTIVGGTAGNVCNVLLRQDPMISLGFSTALFAALGAISGTMAEQGDRKKAMLPVAAGAALLALLGTGGERTDYVAHVMGIVCGMILGAVVQWYRQAVGLAPLVQWGAGAMAIMMLIFAWGRAGIL